VDTARLREGVLAACPVQRHDLLVRHAHTSPEKLFTLLDEIDRKRLQKRSSFALLLSKKRCSVLRLLADEDEGRDKNVDTDEIRMCFQTNVSPCIVRPKEGNQFIFLVLPIRTFD
jgi:hypothetical protein